MSASSDAVKMMSVNQKRQKKTCTGKASSRAGSEENEGKPQPSAHVHCRPLRGHTQGMSAVCGPDADSDPNSGVSAILSRRR
eukprot:352143-Chlamydomonas_euryale.AAC.1